MRCVFVGATVLVLLLASEPAASLEAVPTPLLATPTLGKPEEARKRRVTIGDAVIACRHSGGFARISKFPRIKP
jgi:hypothetical protein